jgi:Ca-activated chloride channel family protein
VPGQLLGWQTGDSVAVTVPTVFLSDKGGGIFFTLAKAPDVAFLPATAIDAGEWLAAAEVTYLPVGAIQTGLHSISVMPPGAQMSPGMRTGRLLIDEFLAIHTAVTAHYRENDQEKAFQLVHAMAKRLQDVHDSGFEGERKLVNGLDEQLTFLSGHSSEGGKRSNFAMLWGKWEVTRVAGAATYARHDVLEFLPDDSFHVSYYRPRDGETEATGEYQYNNRQLLLTDSELVFNYRVSKDRLTLKRVRGEDEIFLRKVP